MGGVVPCAGATSPAVNVQNGATATKSVIYAAVSDPLEPQQAECTRTHDAWLTSHIQVTPADEHWVR